MTMTNLVVPCLTLSNRQLPAYNEETVQIYNREPLMRNYSGVSVSARSDGPQSSPTPDSRSQDPYVSLQKWVEDNGGGLYEGVELYSDPVKGNSLRVRPDYLDGIPGSKPFVSCPITTTMSYLNLKSSSDKLPQHSFVHSPEFLDAAEPDGAVAFLLMDQYLQKDESFWAPYIRILPGPDEVTTIQHYEDEDLEWLEGTSLVSIRAQRLHMWREQYRKALVVLRNTSSNTSISNYTWELFRWAKTIFTSRSFTSAVLTGYFEKNPDMRVATEFKEYQVLLPLVDMANHKPAGKATWHAEQKVIALSSPDGLQPGEEICTNYGPRNNTQLMSSYGFCMVDNICDYRDIVFRPPPGSPFQEARQLQLHRYFRRGEEQKEDQFHIFNIFHPLSDGSKTTEGCIFSADVLDALPIAAANNREAMYIDVEKERLHLRVPPLVESRVILNAVSQIVVELLVNITRLKQGGYLNQQPQNLKQYNAQCYRQSQLVLAENALLVAEWTLSMAKIPASFHLDQKNLLQKHLSFSPATRFGIPVRERLTNLLTSRRSMLKQTGELFLNEGVVSVLPNDTGETFHDFLRNILRAVAPALAKSPRDSGSNLFIYALFLCFALAAYRKGIVKDHGVEYRSSQYMGHRLYVWIDFLLRSYGQPEDREEDLCEMTCDVDDFLNSIVRSLEGAHANQRWIFNGIERGICDWPKIFSMNKLRWAWFIAEEEALPLAKNALRLGFQGINESESEQEEAMEVRDLKLEYYFYIPRADSRN